MSAAVAVAPSSTGPPVESVERSQRLPEIDALRGLAACSVVIWHSLLVFSWMEANTRADGLTPLNVLKYTPLRMLAAGPQAVMLFFVISGFVLAIPFLDGRGAWYGAFLVRRVLRIWPAYALFCAVALISATTLGGRGHVGHLSSWFAGKWHAPVTAAVVARHALLVGDFSADQFNPVIWSLVHEMRISLFFPVIAVLVRRIPWRVSLALVALWSTVGVELVPAQANATSWLFTLNYAAYFVCGALLAKHRRPVIAFLSLRGRHRMFIAVAAVSFYTYPGWFPSTTTHAHAYVVDNAAMMVGAVGILVLAITSIGFGRLLRLRLPQIAGRISYSLYLCHAVVLLAAFHLLYTRVPTISVLAIAWAIAAAVAYCGERFVEQPAIRFGRRLTGQKTTGATREAASTAPREVPS